MTREMARRIAPLLARMFEKDAASDVSSPDASSRGVPVVGDSPASTREAAA